MNPSFGAQIPVEPQPESGSGLAGKGLMEVNGRNTAKGLEGDLLSIISPLVLFSLLVKSLNSDTILPALVTCFCHFLVVLLWASFLTSLCLKLPYL